MATNEQFPDGPTAAPHVYRVVFENERVRVLDVRMAPGAESGMHAHPQCMVYWITSGSLRISFPDGRSVDVSSPAGQTAVAEAVAHAGVNTGDNEIHALMVEFK